MTDISYLFIPLLTDSLSALLTFNPHLLRFVFIYSIYDLTLDSCILIVVETQSYNLCFYLNHCHHMFVYSVTSSGFTGFRVTGLKGWIKA